jgi:AcrR family transcriptional regulator/acyl-coenzyme A thioesterase PaaI-like protein
MSKTGPDAMPRERRRAQKTLKTATSLQPVLGFPEHLLVRISLIEPSQVIGELAFDPEQKPVDDHAPERALMSFASLLCSAGVQRNLMPGSSGIVLESHANHFSIADSDAFEGTAVPVHVSGLVQVWRADIKDKKKNIVVSLTQTQLVVDRQDTVGSVPEPVKQEKRVGRLSAYGGADEKSIPEMRRRQVFEAASEVFGEKGFAATSTRDIATAAGMPVPTMYQYFRSKEEILSLVFETYMTEIGLRLRSSAHDLPGTATEKLARAIRTNMEMYDRYRRQIRLMYQETRSLGPENRNRVLNLTRTANAVWGELIREGIESGEFKTEEPDVIANFIPMLCATWVLRRWNLPNTQLSELCNLLVRFVLNGLSVSSQPANESPKR